MCPCSICESKRRGVSEEAMSFKPDSKAFKLANEIPGMPIRWYEDQCSEPLQKEEKKKEA